ncbi:MAG: RNA-directed DNA polymerase [Oscillatoria princeps RMCB-10]|jgi:hypothetical protein|nr:RNA-directed DNA polymerase [Oscillatoria princeps RMCB-10]
MTSNSDRYHFHPYIQQAYTAVHEWLARQQKAHGYKNVSYQESGQYLSEKTLKGAAVQYNIYFPAHYFKVAKTLKKIVPGEKLLSWINHNSHLCLIDIGCGAGAASAAFVETVMCLREERNPVNIYCVGIDVNPYALPIYNQFMMQIKSKVRSSSKINLEYKVVPEGIREAVLKLILSLRQKREQWQQPFLSHVFMMQSNVIDFLEKEYKTQRDKHQDIKTLGVASEILLNDWETFTQEYALAYKQLCEEVPIERLHAITIGSSNDKYPIYDDLRRLQDMASALEQTFGSSRHKVERVDLGTHQVNYGNPTDCYWYKFKKEYFSDFHLNVSTITSAKLEEDQDWNEVISIENLELAWARAHHNFLKDAIFDEVEIRLFEKNLENNLNNIQKQLMAYIEDVARSDERISYKFPKNLSKARPRLLSRMEEEILSTAIIQKLGHKADCLQSSYAYRLARTDGNQDTEYLYEPWFNTYYDGFLAKARESVLQLQQENGVVLQIDIKSYYTEIIQDKLIELATQELRTQSERIRWLLQVLLSKGLDGHADNRGLAQGSIGSGFYANLYLTDIDARFGSENNEWDVKYHRYADDIILVIPNPENINAVRGALEEELRKLGLSLNPDKTHRYEVSDFLVKTEQDKVLTQLSDSFKKLITPLEVMNSEYRKEFRKCYNSSDDERWWYFLDCYRQCLQRLSIYVTETHLSRRIYKYLFKSRKKIQQEQELQLRLPELPTDETFPDTDDTLLDTWRLSFERSNPDWIKDRDKIRSELINLFRESRKDFKQLDESNLNRERSERRIRFAVNRLCMLGLAEIRQELLEILCDYPWILRTSILYSVESLARQGYRDEIMRLLAHYAEQHRSN